MNLKIDTNKYSVVIFGTEPSRAQFSFRTKKHDISSLIIEAGEKILVRNHNHFIK